MRAVVVERVGAGPAVREVAEPERAPGGLLVEVTAAPLNPIDVSIAAGRFYIQPTPVPYVAGKEGVGRVLESGRLRPGTRVYFEMPGGLGGHGALAERVAPDERTAIEVPDGVGDSVAACLGIAGLAAWLALDWRAGLGPGETVLILGASGAVGQLGVQAARLLGAGRVVAAARSAEGRERALALGADAVVDLGAAASPQALADAIRDAAGGAVEVTLDPLWGEPAVAAALAASQGGRLVQVGQTAGAEATLPSSAVRGKALSILGHSNLNAPREVAADAYRRMAEHASAGRLTVELEELPLEQTPAAWERQQEFPHRKLVLRP